MTELIEERALPAPRRGWLNAAIAGVVLIVVAMIVVWIVAADKPHFGWMVTWVFLPVISCGVIVGGLLVTVAAFMLPIRKTWRGITLIVWGRIAATSPGFGIMILLPWALLVVTLPLVIVILVRERRKLTAAA